MTINTINLGAAPNDNNGDPARTAFGIHNNNFTDTANAASRLVQTSPTDATADSLMAVGAFGLGGGLSLSSTVHVTGDPQDIQGTGVVFGTASGGSLGIPGKFSSNKGTLTTYSSDSTPAGNEIREYSRKWTDGIDFWVQAATNATTWAVWQRVWTEAIYQPEDANGLGVRVRLFNNGTAVSNGDNADANVLFTYTTTLTGDVGGFSSSARVGVWECVKGSGQQVGNTETGDFVRVA